MPSRLERFLDLRPGDLRRGTFLALYYFFIINAYTNGQILRDALFLNRFEAVWLPHVDFAGVVLVGVVLAIYFRIGRRMPLIQLLTGTLCFFAANGLLFWWIAAFRPGEWLYPVVYVWVGMFGVLATSQVWTLTNYVLTGREAKRLVGFIGIGGTLGGVVGGFLSHVVSRSMSAESLFLVMVVSIAISTGLVFAIAENNGSRNAALRASPAIKSHRSATLRESLSLVASSRHLLIIAALICVGSVATYIAGWQFRAILKDTSPDKDAMAAFLGTFLGTTGVLAMIIQVVLTPRLLRYFGIRVVLSILPLALMAGTGAVILTGAMWAVTFLRGTDRVIRYAVDNGAFQLLFLPISSETKVQTKSFLDTVVLRSADALGAVAVLSLTVGLGLGPAHLGWIVLGLLLLWLVIAQQAGTQYVATLGDTLRQHRMDAERLTESPLDRSATQMLITGLRSEDPSKILYMLTLLETRHLKDAHGAIRQLLWHPAAEVRAKAASMLRRVGDTSVIPRIEELVTDPHLTVRTEAVLFLAQRKGIDPLLRIQDLGDFPDFSIQAATLAFLAQSEEGGNLEAARLILQGMIDERGVAGRHGRVEAARVIEILPESFSASLCTLLADDDPDVLREASRTAAKRRNRLYVSPLIALLGNPEVKEAAHEALTVYGEDINEILRQHLAGREVPLEVKREIPDLLVTVAKREAREPLLANLRQTDSVLRFRIISSLNKLHTLYPDIQLDATTVETVLASEIMNHYRAYQIVGRMESHREQQSFDIPLKKSMHHELERIFRLLKMLYPKHDLRSAFLGLDSGDRAHRDSALEFIDNTLKPSIRRLLVPLVDSEISLTERVRLANRVLPSTIDSKDDALLALMDTEDPWLKSCAAHLIGILGLKQFQATVDRWASDHDPVLREKAQRAQQRLAAAT
jgi:AAA family ATP:ADP antiporter